MGHSATIKEQAAKDTEFQNYINERNKDLDATVDAAKAKMAEQIRAFYDAGGWGDAKPLTSGAYQHLATTSEWSLDHVSQMIDAVRGAIFGSSPLAKTVPEPDKVPVSGNARNASLDPVDDTTRTLMAVMGGTELIIANAAFQAISGILAAFKSSTSTEMVKNIEQKDIVPGMSLFVCVMENKYHRQDFFNDETIVQNFYIFDVRMSANRAADIAKFDRIGGLIAQQADLETQASDMSAQIKGMKITEYKAKHNGDLKEALKAYKSDFDALEGMLQDINKQVDACGLAIDAMRTAARNHNALAIAAKRKEVLAM